MLTMYRGREKPNEAKSPLVMISDRGRCLKKNKKITLSRLCWTRCRAQEMLQDFTPSTILNSSFSGSSVQTQEPWRGFFLCFHLLVRPSPIHLGLGMRRAGLGWAGPKPSGCSGALGHPQSSTVGHGAALEMRPQCHGLQLLSEQ